ncbi:MAG: MFS transporter [Enterocloster asparagiformis]|nr:MFS transporter [Enterocloster asparagiformis]
MMEDRQKAMTYRLLAVNTFVWITTALYMPFIGAYYTQQGITPLQIGFLTSIGPVVSILIQPIWAYISDRSGRHRRILIIVSIGSGVAILSYLVHVSFGAFVVATLLLTAFNTSLLPLSDALVTNLAARLNANFAHIRMGGTIGFAVTALILGNFLKGRPSLIFVLGSAGYFLLVGFLLLLPADHERAGEKRAREGGTGNRQIFKNKRIYLVLFLAFIMQLGMSFTGTFYSVYVISLGYGQSIVGLSSFISAMSEVPILMCANRLIRKFGAVNLLIFSVLMMALRLLLAGSGVLPLMLMSQLLQSVTYMTSYYSCVMFISENVVEGKISQGQSRLAIVQAGIGSVAGNILGGLMTDRFGVHRSFMVMSACIVLTACLNAGLICCYNRRKKAGMCVQ